MKVKFFKPYLKGNELKYIQDIFENSLIISGDGKYTRLCHEFLEKRFHINKVLLTTSCTTALEMAVRLVNLPMGSEIIAPSFTFSSTINAILLQNELKVVFADIDPYTLNIDPKEIEKKITKNTKAIMVMHYAGVACDMEPILALAKEHELQIIEDAAQGIDAKWKDKYLGSIGDYGCYSFHETKNIVSGEGGAICINTGKKEDFERAEIIREKGTNRSKFFRGQVDKYTWVEIGGSALPSDILAAMLYGQLENLDIIQKMRLDIWDTYFRELSSFASKELLTLPTIPSYATHNAHMFYILLPTAAKRDEVMNKLREKEIMASFHYIPLHSAPQGMRIGYKAEDLPKTEDLSSRLLRLPLYAGMKDNEVEYVMQELKKLL